MSNSKQQIEEATAAYETKRGEVSRKTHKTLFEQAIDVIGLEGLRDGLRSLELPKRVTAAALVAHGPSHFAREFDAFFDREGGVRVRQGHVLFLADDDKNARSHWSQVPNCPGAWMALSLDASRFLEAFGEPTWFKEHIDARGVALVDGKAHLFVRERGVWFSGAEFAAKVEAKRAAEEADRDAANERFFAEQRVKEAEQASARERARKEHEARMAELAARHELEAAKREEELAAAEALRQANLGDVAADPMTIVTMGVAIGLIDEEKGTVRKLLREQDLIPFGEYDPFEGRGLAVRVARDVAISEGAASVVRDAVRASDRYFNPDRDEIAPRILDVVQRTVAGRGRFDLVINVASPYTPPIEVRLIVCHDGKRKVIASVDECVPLAWRGL